jgi:ribosomal protein L37AE/L43A
MAEMIECPRCGVDTAMPQERTGEGAGGWRCPACGHVWAPGTEPKDTDFERTIHIPAGGRSEDD